MNICVIYNLNTNNHIFNNNIYNNNPYNNYNYNYNIYNNNQPYDYNYNNIYQQNNEVFVYNNKINENNELKNNLETANRLKTNNNLKNSAEETIQKKEVNKEDEKKEEKKDDPPETCIRKYKKAVRGIEKLKQLNKEIKKESQNEINNVNSNKKCTFVSIVRFIAFSIVILSDVILPISLDKDDEYSSSREGTDLTAESSFELAVLILMCIPFTIICSSYTIIIIYATKRRRYITGDFLYDKQINDNLSLLKTVQIVCGYSFSLLYCNLYFWRSIVKKGKYGHPNFYEQTIIPDYTFEGGVSVIMFAKIIIIVISIFDGLCFSKFSFFQNDLAEYGLSGNNDKYDNDAEFKGFLEQKKKIVKILNSPN